MSRFWGITYPQYHISFVTHFSDALFFKTIFIGIICGIAAWIYVEAVHHARNVFTRLRTRYSLWPPLVPFIGGLILAALILLIPTDYFGLSLPLMKKALDGQTMPYLGFLWKTLLVAVTLGSGYYGGVVTPQFVIGAVTGNAFAHLMGISPTLGAAVGLVAVMAAASNTPIAAIVMGVELFGGAGMLYVTGASIAAYVIIGHRSIYPDQRLAYPKSSWMRARPDLPVGQEKVHLTYGLLKWWRQHRRHR